MQWKLVRNQTGMLAQQLMDLQKEVKDVNKTTELLSTKLSSVEEESCSFEKSVKEFVGKLFDKIDANHGDLRAAFRQSIVDNHRRHEAHQNRISTINSTYDTLKGKLSDFDQELRKCRSDVSQYSQHLSSLSDQLASQAAEAKKRDEVFAEHHWKLVERIEEECRQRDQAHEELKGTCQDCVDKERKARENHHEHVLTHIESFNADVARCKEEMPALRGKLASMADAFATMQNQNIKQLEAQIAEHPKDVAILERRLEQLQANISQEGLARNSMAELFDKMIKNERTKLSTMITQHAATSKMEADDRCKQLFDRLDKEVADREAQIVGLHAKHDREKASFHDRVSVVENSHTSNEQRFHAVMTEMRDLESRYRKMEDTMACTARDTLKDFQAEVAEERGIREASIAKFEAQLDWYGEIHDKVRDLFMSKGGHAMAMGFLAKTHSSSRATSPTRD